MSSQEDQAETEDVGDKEDDMLRLDLVKLHFQIENAKPEAELQQTRWLDAEEVAKETGDTDVATKNWEILTSLNESVEKLQKKYNELHVKISNAILVEQQQDKAEIVSLSTQILKLLPEIEATEKRTELLIIAWESKRDEADQEEALEAEAEITASEGKGEDLRTQVSDALNRIQALETVGVVDLSSGEDRAEKEGVDDNENDMLRQPCYRPNYLVGVPGAKRRKTTLPGMRKFLRQYQQIRKRRPQLGQQKRYLLTKINGGWTSFRIYTPRLKMQEQRPSGKRTSGLTPTPRMTVTLELVITAYLSRCRSI